MSKRKAGQAAASKRHRAVPRAVRLKLLAECGHRCSVPGCGTTSRLIVHHIDGDRADSDEENLLVLCAEHHRAAEAAVAGLDKPTCERLKRSLSPAHVGRQLEAMCDAAKGERFEDGMESHFSRELVSLIEQRGDKAVEALGSLIAGNTISGEVASEALRWLGLMEQGPAYGSRRDVLERSLSSSEVAVRDGAALGLSFLDDLDAIPYIRAAVGQEGREWLRDQMREVLAQLEERR